MPFTVVVASGKVTSFPVLEVTLKPDSSFVNARFVATFTSAPSLTFNIPLTWDGVNTSGIPGFSVTLPIILFVEMFSILLKGIPDGISVFNANVPAVDGVVISTSPLPWNEVIFLFVNTCASVVPTTVPSGAPSVAIDPNPNAVLASEALVEPVPPSLILSVPVILDPSRSNRNPSSSTPYFIWVNTSWVNASLAPSPQLFQHSILA